MISGFVEMQVARLGAVVPTEAEPSDPERLDRLWHEVLVAVNGPEPFGHPGGRTPG